MRILVSIDDTDQLKTDDFVEVISTGKLAGKLADALEDKGWGKCKPVTRHQLLVHPDVPYTSHNSSMCFEAEISDDKLDDFINYGGDFLKREHAPGADPGLCVVVLDRLTKPGWLISFGYLAKNEVLNKDDAYSLAAELGIHLSEHGGTGDGVIGALAGAGLRLSGNDGRFRGKFKIKADNDIITVKEIRNRTFTDIVRNIEDGRILDDNERVMLGDTVKPVLLDNKAVLLVFPFENTALDTRWQTCSKLQIKGY